MSEKTAVWLAAISSFGTFLLSLITVFKPIFLKIRTYSTLGLVETPINLSNFIILAFISFSILGLIFSLKKKKKRLGIFLLILLAIFAFSFILKGFLPMAVVHSPCKYEDDTMVCEITHTESGSGDSITVKDTNFNSLENWTFDKCKYEGTITSNSYTDECGGYPGAVLWSGTVYGTTSKPLTNEYVCQFDHSLTSCYESFYSGTITFYSEALLMAGEITLSFLGLIVGLSILALGIILLII
ncbi:MAG: hypothetical protein ACTSWZ_07815 [Candidatus Heimdallarchaeaceae archaeon]